MANSSSIDRVDGERVTLPIRLLDLEKPDLADPFVAKWNQRLLDIAAGMETSLAVAMQRLTSVQREKVIDHRPFDAVRMINRFTKESDSVGRIAEGEDRGTIIYAFRKLGPDGKLYYIQPGAGSDQKLRASLFGKILPNLLDRSVETERDSTWVQRTETDLFVADIPLNYATYLKDFLQDPSIPGITSLYRRRKPDEARAAFYNAFPITPIGGGLPESLASIPEQSLHAFFVVDSLSRLQGEQQLALVEQLLRTLRPDGKLLIRDTAKGQVTAECYVDQVTSGRLVRQELSDLEDPKAWILFIQSSVPEITYSFPSPEASGRETEHQQNLKRLAAEVYSVLLESGVTDKNRTIEEVTAAARKKIGIVWLSQHVLLGTAMTEFRGKGDLLNNMFTYAIETSMPKAVEPEVSIPAASEPILAAEVDVPEEPAAPAGAVAIESVAEVPAVPQENEIVIGAERFKDQKLWTLEQITMIVAEVLGQDLGLDRVRKLLKEQSLVREQRGHEARGRSSGNIRASLAPNEAHFIANVIARNADSLRPNKARSRHF